MTFDNQDPAAPSLRERPLADSTLMPAAFLMLLAALFISPLLLGSNRDWAWPALAILCVLPAAFLCLKKTRQVSGHAMIIILSFLALAGWMLFQYFGLPRLVDPITQDFFQTRSEILKLAMLLAAFWLTIQLVTTRKRLMILLYVVMAAGVLQALLGGVQQLMFDLPRSRGTFPNPNHLAGYLELTICLSIGAILARQQSERASFGILDLVTGPVGRIRIIIIILVIVLVMTRSRMGNVAFFSSILITALIAFYYSRTFNRYMLFLLASILALDLLIIGNYFGMERLRERFESAPLEAAVAGRVNLQVYNLRIVRDHLFAGTGAGSYETAFRSYRDKFVAGRADHAENDYLELLVELGVIGCLPLLVILVTGVHAQVRRLRPDVPAFDRGIAFGCLAGTISILIHGTVDVNLQIPSNSLLFVVLLALPLSPGANEPEPASPESFESD